MTNQNQTKTQKILEEKEKEINEKESVGMLEMSYSYYHGKVPYSAEGKKEIHKKIDEMYQKKRRELQKKEIEQQEEEWNKKIEKKIKEKRIEKELPKVDGGFDSKIGQYSEEVLSGRYTE